MELWKPLPEMADRNLSLTATVLRERSRHLHGDDETAEKADQKDNWQATYANNVHLDGDVIHVVRASKEIADRTPGKNIKILDRGYWRLQEIEQTAPRISRCYHALPRGSQSRTILGDG